MLKNQTPLSAARDFERQAVAQIPEGDRPLFHLTPMVGWMNDPNGFCYYRGEYHLFYQYHPYNTIWGPMHWGHAKSRDLLHWTYLPTALAPDTDADAGGCFSGSALPLDDGRLMLMYTGVQPAGTGHKELQAQCVAIGDGVDFTKLAENPVIGAALLPKGYSVHDFRDPKILRGEDGRLYCVVGNRHETRQGVILLLESEDGQSWRFVTELDASRGELGRMWECPDFFALDGQQVLITSPQEMQATPDGVFHAGYGTIALLGDYDGESHRFTRRSVQPVDDGLDFYAPQTMLAPDGRRIMIGWMENWETLNGAPRRHKWYGRTSLPRELSVREGRLCQQPIRELEALWQDDVHLTGVRLAGETALDGISGRKLDLTVTLHVGEGSCRRFELRFARDARCFTVIRCALSRGELVFDRTNCGSTRDIPHVRSIKAGPKDGVMKLRLILDGESAELFVNDGEHVISSLIDTPMDAQGITFCADGELTVDVEKHALG